jgi:hypothetical protein
VGVASTTVVPRPPRRVLWFATIGLYFVACLAMDLLPRHGPPDFRYTGSDPAVAVWNLGWPLAEFIYDPRTGLHIGPTAVPLLVLQVVVLVFGVAVALFVGLHRRRSKLNRIYGRSG